MTLAQDFEDFVKLLNKHQVPAVENQKRGKNRFEGIDGQKLAAFTLGVR
jgi:hypothetical protein